jgi:uncharacterized protein YidB (DUF937 family)
MSFLDDLKQMAGSGMDQASGASHVAELLHSPEIGGISGLMQMFHQKGMGGVVSSWVSNEANHPITGEQIIHVLGQERVNALAGKIGVAPDTAADKLAQFLPMVVDKLTPHGRVEEAPQP